jgi:hypothetical protein
MNLISLTAMIFLFAAPSDTTEMSSPSFVADSDWDLFSTEEDNDGDISLEEISDIAKAIPPVPGHLDDCSSHVNETQTSEPQNCKQEDDISNNESIKLENLYDSDTTSTQLSNISETLLQSSSPSPTSSSQFPNYDKLQNLPTEIVERPRFLFFFASNL